MGTKTGWRKRPFHDCALSLRLSWDDERDLSYGTLYADTNSMEQYSPLLRIGLFVLRVGVEVLFAVGTHAESDLGHVVTLLGRNGSADWSHIYSVVDLR